MYRTFGLAALLLSTASFVQAAPLDCGGLTAEALGLSDVTLTDVAAVPEGEESPVAQCRVRGVTAERMGADGRPYALRFELALPDAWNGDYVHQFNGGNDGEVKPATGALSDEAGTGTASPLMRGFAVVSSDAGHDGAANEDAGLAGGARFGFDFEARRMYGYGAVALLDPLARQIVEGFYGQPIDHAYGVGCSNGGRHAFVSASRMPEAFDGILAGAPGYILPKAALAHAVDVQALTAVTGDLATALTPDDLTLLADSIRGTCDALDGLDDGLVMNTPACQDAFDVTALQCSDGQNSACLSADKITALQTIHAGTATGEEPYYSAFPWDTGIASGGWRFWKLESPIPPWGNKPLIAVMGSASLAQIFTTPPTEVGGSPDALEGFLKDFDIQARAAEIYATSDAFPESAMDVMAPPDYDAPDLAGFRDAGGKMIVFHGVSDPVFSELSTADWYAKLDANNDDAAENFTRYYPVPGMTHCSGGPAADSFDMFDALVTWVETGTAPDVIVARTRADNPDVPPTLAGATRPLCPAPLTARFAGGDGGQADSFICE